MTVHNLEIPGTGRLLLRKEFKTPITGTAMVTRQQSRISGAHLEGRIYG